MKSSPVIAPVNNSLPFLTCSALSPPVIIWIVATSMMTSEIAPAVPARKVSSADVKPDVLTGRQPSAVSIASSPQLPVGSNANVFLGKERPDSIMVSAGKYVRMEIWFLSGKDFFMSFLFPSC